MDQSRSFKAVGFAMLVIGAMIFALGLSGGAPALRIGGPTLGFFGIVLLAQAKRRSRS